jgi:hypothetical protein
VCSTLTPFDLPFSSTRYLETVLKKEASRNKCKTAQCKNATKTKNLKAKQSMSANYESVANEFSRPINQAAPVYTAHTSLLFS